jgi:hypothetical protein
MPLLEAGPLGMLSMPLIVEVVSSSSASFIPEPGWWIDVAVRSSGLGEVWRYDVPPTPHTSVTTTRQPLRDLNHTVQPPAILLEPLNLRKGAHEVAIRLRGPDGLVHSQIGVIIAVVEQV